MSSRPCGSYRVRINRILDYIAEFPEKECSFEVLSRLSGFSAFHFHRIFREYAGEALGAYQRRVRLERAVFMLRYHPGKTVTQIAFELGFNSGAAFTRAFTGHFGVAPRGVRSGGECIRGCGRKYIYGCVPDPPPDRDQRDSIVIIQ